MNHPNRIQREIEQLWGRGGTASCDLPHPARSVSDFGGAGVVGWLHAGDTEDFGTFVPAAGPPLPMSGLVVELKEQIRQLQSELLTQRVRALESHAVPHLNQPPEVALITAGVLQKLTELRNITKAIFSCEPNVAVQTDHEIPEDHYLLFHVTIKGEVESAIKLQDAWYEATSAILGKSADKIRLMLSIE